MAKEYRVVYDYYYNQKMLFRLGYAQFMNAHNPFPPEIHEHMTEFVYMVRGSQKYRCQNQEYTVNHGEVFFTIPDELHSTGSFPEERSIIYYLIIDLSMMPKLNLFVHPEEYQSLGKYITGSTDRIFPVPDALANALRGLLKCFPKKDSHFDTHVKNALSEVLIALCASQDLSKAVPMKGIEHSLRYIQEHLEDVIQVPELAALEHTSVSTYHKYFVQAVGMPPGEYILRQKTEKAGELLAATNLSITEIAHRYGFSSSQYFATVFRRFYNTTPTAYRARMQHQSKTLY